MIPKIFAPVPIEENPMEIVEDKMSWEQAISIGMQLREAKDNSQWQLGDLAANVEKKYGTNALEKFANEIGINKKSLQQYRRVALAFPKDKRISFLSHRHHLILAARKDRFDWLEKAADNSWSVSQLQFEIKKSEGKANIEEKPPRVFKCPICGGWRIETDNVCTCPSERRKYEIRKTTRKK